METPSSSPTCPECGAPLVAGTGPGAAAGLCPRCLLASAAQPSQPTASPLASTSLDQVAAAFPHLQVIELIGQGGMGAVFKVRQPKLDRFAALKLLPRSLAGDPAFAERFEREAKLLARLSHPNIVSVYDFGPAGDFFFLLMEYVDGVNLRQAMRASPFEPRQALQVVGKICEALQYAHDEGVLHRDIKPENILLDTKGRVKLVDFGIAKLIADSDPTPPATEPIDPALTQAGASLGTPSYMAPEQREHPSQVDERADIYSLGVVFYELLTGQLPAAEFLPPSQQRHAGSHDPRIDAIVQQALQADRNRRQRTAGEVRTQVETVVEGAGVSIAYASYHSRISWPAILGACWAPLFFMLGFISLPSLHWTLQATALTLGIGAPFGTTILGWIAVTQIRRSEGRLYGLGLAVFDGLLFPLLLLDGALIFALFLIVRTADSDNGNGPGPHTFLNPLPSLAILAIAMVFLDSYIIRRTWRAVNQPIAGMPPPPLPNPASRSRHLPPDPPALAIAAIGFAALAGVIGAAAWFYMPDPPPIMVWSIPIAAVLAVLLAIPARANRLAKYALVFGGATIAAWIAVFIAFASFATHDPHRGVVRYREFIVDAGVVDRLVPPQSRQPGDQFPYDGSIGNPPNASSQTVDIDGPTLRRLLNAADNSAGLLMDRTRDATGWWPRLADTWAFTGPAGTSDGDAGGFVGVRQQDGVEFLRLDYAVRYGNMNWLRGDLSARIGYEGPAPAPGHARVFLVPFTQNDGSAKYLVLAVEAEPRQFVAPPAPKAPAVISVYAADSVEGDSYDWIDAVGQVAAPASTQPVARPRGLTGQIAVLFDIPDVDVKYVVAERDAGRAIVVDIFNRGWTQKLAHGSVAGVDNQIDTATGTLRCRASVQCADGVFVYPGQFVNVLMECKITRGVTLVPSTAIRHSENDANHFFVYVIGPDNILLRRPVKVGGYGYDASAREITSGLSPGEKVVLGWPAGLQDGCKVTWSRMPGMPPMTTQP